MASQQGSFSVISTYVEMILRWEPFNTIPTSDLHVCGDDPKFAINLFMEYCKENEFNFSTYYNFAESFYIPLKFYYLLPNCTEDWIIA